MALTAHGKGSKINFAKEIDDTVNRNCEYEKEKKKGRPSGGTIKKLSLSIPLDLYEGVETGASLFFKGNKTAYINALIKKDLKENLDKYKKFKEMIQN